MVGRILAFAGLCGAGKSTAVDYLAESAGGQVIYFGATVLRAVADRGLPPGSQSEQAIRIELRKENGPAYLAMQEGKKISELLSKGIPLFIDAIYVIEEFEYLSKLCPAVRANLIAIDTSLENRLSRLKVRSDRPLSEREIRARDAVERQKLKTGNVFSQAHHISNDGDLEEFHATLRNLP